MAQGTTEIQKEGAPAGVQFIASFPTGGQPIKIGADTMTILLEIPRTELANGLELIAMQEMALMVTVRPLTKDEWLTRKKKDAA